MKLLLKLLLLLPIAACSAIPRDPERSLTRIQGGVLRVGISHAPPLSLVEPALSGTEVELVTALTAELGATVEWEAAGEGALLAKLEKQELDLVIGGLNAKSPWADKVALTRPYLESEEGGERQEIVWAVPPGENAWLLRVERFLQAQKRAARNHGEGNS